MTSHDKYLDDLLHDAWIPLPPAEHDDGVVLQCHRDAGKKRSYFRVTLTACAVRGFDDPEERGLMKVLGVAVNDGQLCLEGVEGGELRLALPLAIKHVDAGSVDDNRSWTTKLGIGDGEEPPPATDVVPIMDKWVDDPDVDDPTNVEDAPTEARERTN